MSNWTCRAAGRGKRLSEPSNYRKIEQVLNLLIAGCIAMRWWADELDRLGEHGRVIKMSA